MEDSISSLKSFIKRLWNSGRISLHATCLLTSAYFVQDGFVTVVDSLFIRLTSSSLLQQNDTSWRLWDGFILLTLGYMCVLGLENGRLNLVRWPTLLLFIYKVIEYFVEQVFRQLRDKNGSNPTSTTTTTYSSSPHSHRFEWTGHFLIPSLHIVSVTLFLYRFVNKYNYTSGPRQLAKFVPLAKSLSRRRAAIRRRGGGEGYQYHRDCCSTSSLIEHQQPPPPPPPPPPTSSSQTEIPMISKRKVKSTTSSRKLITTTSFHSHEKENKNDEEMQLCGRSGDEEEEDDEEGDARVRLLEFDDRDEE